VINPIFHLYGQWSDLITVCTIFLRTYADAIKVFVYVQLDVFQKLSLQASGLHNLNPICFLHPTKQEVHPTFMAMHPTLIILSKWPTFSNKKNLYFYLPRVFSYRSCAVTKAQEFFLFRVPVL